METLYRAGLSNAVSATVLALVVACLGRVLARRPAVLHCLWLIVLLKLVTPSLYEVSIPWPESPRTVADDGSCTAAFVASQGPEVAETTALDDEMFELSPDSPGFDVTPLFPQAATVLVDWSSVDWMRLACLIWAAGTMITVAVSIARVRRFQRLLRESPPADDDTQDRVDLLATRLGLDRSPLVLWTEARLPPLVWSLGFRARMIIPRALWKGLGEQERSTLIIHELAHLRRGDHLVRIFELFVTALFWWHPVLWWARQALRDVEEQCCDAWVVWSCPGAAKSYAETLLETLDFLNQSDLSEPLLASGFGRVHHLRKRLTMIMSGNTPRLLGLWGTLGSLCLGAVLLPVNASWAQKPEERREVKIIVNTDEIGPENITVVEADAATLIGSAATTVEGGKPEAFTFEFNTDDSQVVVAGSVSDAIKKVKAELDALGKDTKPSDKIMAKKRALKRVIGELEEIAKQDKDDRSIGDKLKAEKALRKVVVRQIEDNKKLSAEQRAEIEKASAQVRKLADELRVKQKELQDAKTKLAKLSMSRIRGAATVVRDLHDKEKLDLDVRVRELNPALKKLDRPLTVIRDGGQKRIDDLEKKLEKLLEEVASLKKDRAK